MNTEKKLSEIFDIQQSEIIPQTFDVIVSDNDDADADFEFARKNIKELAEKGKIAVDNILHVANATDHPRAYEVAATLIKNVSDLNKDLLDLRKKRKSLIEQEYSNQKTSDINVNQAVFVGSTAELIKAIKKTG